MKNRTFCILLASFLMVLGASAALMRGRQAEGDAPDVPAAAQPAGQMSMPVVRWTIAEEFGAVFSEEYGQWTLAEGTMLITVPGEMVYAPLSGVVKAVEAADGGSMLTLACDAGATLRMGPVAGVRVFAGSRVEQGTALGSAGDALFMQADIDGQFMNPLLLGE